jgi:hypothetical protein
VPLLKNVVNWLSQLYGSLLLAPSIPEPKAMPKLFQVFGTWAVMLRWVSLSTCKMTSLVCNVFLVMEMPNHKICMSSTWIGTVTMFSNVVCQFTPPPALDQQFLCVACLCTLSMVRVLDFS